MNRLLVGSAFAYSIHEKRSVHRKIIDVHRRILIGAQFGGIDQPLIAAMQAFADVNRCLVLVRQALGVEVDVIALDRDPNRLDMLEFSETLHNLRPHLYLR